MQLAASRKLMRDLNENNLLNLTKIRGPISRPQLAALSGLSLATIGDITATLLERNLLVESGIAGSTGGRRAGLLEINPEGGYALGLKLTEHQAIAVLLNLNAEIVYSERIPLTLPEGNAGVSEKLAALIEGLIERSGVDHARLLGIGFGLAGFIDGRQGRVIYSPILGWRDLELAALLTERLAIPVFIDNDVNCFAIYEKLFGQGLPYQNFLVVTVGRGVGLGIVVNGDLYCGAQGGAGEFGHTTLVPLGRSCECGKRGCLETYSSDQGLLTSYFENLTRPDYATQEPNYFAPAASLTVVELLARAKNGDQAACQAFAQAGHLLGVSLANLVNIFNPELILLSGSGVLAGELLTESLEKALRENSFAQMANQLKLVIELDSDESWARGAASLVLRRFFASPARI